MAFDENELMERLREQLRPLNDVDWSRDADIWDENIVTGGKIRTQGSAVKAAADALLKVLNISDSIDEEVQAAYGCLSYTWLLAVPDGGYPRAGTA